MNENVAAVIVTHNRLELLKECLQALLSGSRVPQDIIVIDNNSTDGTREYMQDQEAARERVHYHPLEENTGGAGGFYYGIKLAVQLNPEYIWIMDDDTIAETGTLAEFLLAAEKVYDFGFLCSSVTDPDGMMTSIPSLYTANTPGQYPQWNRHLAEGCVMVSASTFVSVLIPVDAVKTVGLPIKEYFLWGDDTEYTNRISRYYKPGYCVGKSRVLHKKQGARPFDITLETNKNRIPLYRLYFRNNLLNSREYNSPKYHLRYFGSLVIKQPIRIVLKGGPYRLRKWLALWRGIAGYFLNGKLRRKLKTRMKYLD